MGLRINNSSEAADARRSLASSSGKLAQAMQRVASGSRINVAADDPSGLGVSERMRAELASIDQYQRSAYDGMSMTGMADGAASRMQDILERVRELAVQRNNGTLDDASKEAISHEVTELNEELESVVDSATPQGHKFLNVPGNAPVVTLQIGLQEFDEIPVQGMDGPAAVGSAVSDFAAMGSSSASPDIEAIDSALEQVRQYRSDLGATQRRFESAASSLDVHRENLAASESQIRDVDVAKAVSDMTAEKIRQQSSIAMIAQANMSNATVLKLLK